LFVIRFSKQSIVSFGPYDQFVITSKQLAINLARCNEEIVSNGVEKELGSYLLSDDDRLPSYVCLYNCCGWLP
jgi:hypothetical protein